MVTMIDMGMATIEISVVRRFIRKKNSTIMLQIAYGAVYEIALSEYVIGYYDVRRQGAADFLESVVDGFSKAYGTRVRLLCYRDQYGWLSFD